MLSAVIFHGLLVSLATFVHVLTMSSCSVNHSVGIPLFPAVWSAQLKSSSGGILNVFQDDDVNVPSVVSVSHVQNFCCNISSCSSENLKVGAIGVVIKSSNAHVIKSLLKCASSAILINWSLIALALSVSFLNISSDLHKKSCLCFSFNISQVIDLL